MLKMSNPQRPHCHIQSYSVVDTSVLVFIEKQGGACHSPEQLTHTHTHTHLQQVGNQPYSPCYLLVYLYLSPGVLISLVFSLCSVFTGTPANSVTAPAVQHSAPLRPTALPCPLRSFSSPRITSNTVSYLASAYTLSDGGSDLDSQHHRLLNSLLSQ